MIWDYDFSVAERFLKYVTIDTQSDPNSTGFPSTEKQKVLGQLLVDELQQIGITDAELDEWGYVYATIPSTTQKKVPVICFCSHIDTSSDASGKNVKPIVHQYFTGKNIVLPDDTTQVISVKEHSYLKKKIGDDIITASGTTLLGADNKAGIAIIMDATRFLIKHPEIKHGTIRILFTPDEEIGRGVDKVNMQRLGADFGYTLDGGKQGSYTDETFSANEVIITFYGVSAHPGYARKKLVNAMKVAATFMELLPKDAFSPETTEDRDGFVHPIQMEGTVEKAVVHFIIRDFDTDTLKLHEKRLEQFARQAIGRYEGSAYTFESQEQYRNMKDVLKDYPQIGEYVEEAMKRSDVTFKRGYARGGTDGSRLSFMGLPCPDIFTGEMAFHSKHEYISIQDMQKSVEVLCNLAQVWEEKTAE